MLRDPPGHVRRFAHVVASTIQLQDVNSRLLALSDIRAWTLASSANFLPLYKAPLIVPVHHNMVGQLPYLNSEQTFCV